MQVHVNLTEEQFNSAAAFGDLMDPEEMKNMVNEQLNMLHETTKAMISCGIMSDMAKLMKAYHTALIKTLAIEG